MNNLGLFYDPTTKQGATYNVDTHAVNAAPTAAQIAASAPAPAPTSYSAPSRYVAPAPVAPPAPVGPSKAQTDPLLASLGSLDQVLANRTAQSDAEYNKATSGYNAQDTLDKQNYDQNKQQNEHNYTADNQAALLNAADSASGLRGVLASLGALAGSGQDVIRMLVNRAANADTGSARKTFDANATTLNNEWDQTTQKEAQRRADADATHANALQNDHADVLGSRQSILQQLASLWGANTNEGKDYASQASALAPQIAATTKATVAPYQSASSLFSPASLQDYLAGTQNLKVATSGDSTPAINSPDYGPNQKKDKLAGVA